MRNPLQQIVVIIAVLLPFSSVAAPQHSGIQGRTHIYTGRFISGPVRPFYPGVVTLFPVATTFDVLSARSGRVVAQASSDANGDFRVPLPPGRYVIVPDPIHATFFCTYETPEPFEVTVRPREFAGAGFTYLGNCPFIIAPHSPDSSP